MESLWEVWVMKRSEPMSEVEKLGNAYLVLAQPYFHSILWAVDVVNVAM